MKSFRCEAAQLKPHQWKLCLKLPDQEDISCFVSMHLGGDFTPLTPHPPSPSSNNTPQIPLITTGP